MPDTPNLDPPVPEQAPQTPVPEIDPANAPQEAPQTTPMPGEGGAGRPLATASAGSFAPPPVD